MPRGWWRLTSNAGCLPYPACLPRGHWHTRQTRTGALTKTGTGTLRLQRINTFTGDTSIHGGTLQIGYNLALQSSALNTSFQNGGTLTFASNVQLPTLGGLTGSGNLALPANINQLTLNVATGRSLTYGGNLTTSASNLHFTKAGAGTQTFTGQSAFTGSLTITRVGAASPFPGPRHPWTRRPPRPSTRAARQVPGRSP